MLLGHIADITKHIIHSTKHIIHNIVICIGIAHYCRFSFYHGQNKLLFFKRAQKHYNLLSIFSQ